MSYPEIPSGLLERLEQQFPDKAPRKDLGAFGYGVVAGQQEVLDILRHHFEKQQEAEHVHEHGHA